MPTAIRATRRKDASSTKVDVVRIGSGITTRRPPVAADASAPESTSSIRQNDGPAAHEVKRSSCNVVVYAIGGN